MERAKNIVLIPAKEITFEYKNRIICYSRGMRFLTSKKDGISTNLFLSSLEQWEYEQLQNLYTNNLDVIINILIKFIKYLYKTPTKEVYQDIFSVRFR